LNHFDSYAQWLGIPADRRPPNHYELLGLSSGETDAARIHTAGLERSAKVRRYCLGKHGAEATRLLGEIATAFDCLSDTAAKAAYDQKLFGHEVGEAAHDLPPVRHDLSGRAGPASLRAPAHQSEGHGGPALASSLVPPYAHRLPPRSFAWLRRRRAAASSGPARFTFATVFLLAATYGVVWSARHNPARHTHPASSAAQVRPPAAPIEKPAGARPVERAEIASASKFSDDRAPGSVAPPTVVATAVVDRSETKPDDGQLADGPVEPTSGDAQLKAAATDSGRAVAKAAARTANLPAQPNEAPASDAPSPPAAAVSAATKDALPPSAAAPQPGLRQKADAPPFSVVQVTGTEDMEFEDPQADFGKAWRSATRGVPEVLELTFAQPVSALYLRVFETPLFAKVQKVVLYPDAGPPIVIKPVQLSFDAENHVRTWSLGEVRPPSRRAAITFHPTTEGFVEVDAVALLDRQQQPYYPVGARATSSAVADDPDVVDERGPSVADRIEAANAPPAQGDDVLDKADEVAAQVQLDKARSTHIINDYVLILKHYPETQSAVAAVRDLAQMRQALWRTGKWRVIMDAFDRLGQHSPDSDAAKLVPQALREADLPSSRPTRARAPGRR